MMLGRVKYALMKKLEWRFYPVGTLCPVLNVSLHLPLVQFVESHFQPLSEFLCHRTNSYYDYSNLMVYGLPMRLQLCYIIVYLDIGKSTKVNHIAPVS